MSSIEEMMLAPHFDGLAAVIRALVSEAAEHDDGFRRKLALRAATDILGRTQELKSDAARNVMLATAANTCGVPIDFLATQ